MANGLGRCSSCDASIVWGKTAHGKPIPLDPDLVTVVVDPTGAVVQGRISHFATCPNASSHRKRPRKPDLMDANAERYDLRVRARGGFDLKTEAGLPIGHAETLGAAKVERDRLERVLNARVFVHWRAGDAEVVTAKQARIVLEDEPEPEPEPQTELGLDDPEPKANSPADVGY